VPSLSTLSALLRAAPYGLARVDAAVVDGPAAVLAHSHPAPPRAGCQGGARRTLRPRTPRAPGRGRRTPAWVWRHRDAPRWSGPAGAGGRPALHGCGQLRPGGARRRTRVGQASPDPSLTVARYMILKLFISMSYGLFPMYLDCLFCLFVYVEFFRICLR